MKKVKISIQELLNLHRRIGELEGVLLAIKWHDIPEEVKQIIEKYRDS